MNNIVDGDLKFVFTQFLLTKLRVIYNYVTCCLELIEKQITGKVSIHVVVLSLKNYLPKNLFFYL